MHREVKNALVEAAKQGLVKIVSDDGALARTSGMHACMQICAHAPRERDVELSIYITTRYHAHTQTLLGLICHTLSVKFDLSSLCVTSVCVV